jgi:hypothetical protein
MSILKNFKNIVMQRSRSRKLDQFYVLCDSEASVLDVGVSDNEHNSQVNMFLNQFRYSDAQYTGLAVESMDVISMKHPNKKFVEYPGGLFPFEDSEFDWIFSNAVVEHVGSRADQTIFINEMLRVGKNVFFTTPNKFFPVESHTNVIFRHWFDKVFYDWCAKEKPFWSRRNLRLISFGDLKKLMTESVAESYIIRKNRMLGMAMTFTVVSQCSDKKVLG